MARVITDLKSYAFRIHTLYIAHQNYNCPIDSSKSLKRQSIGHQSKISHSVNSTRLARL